MHLKETTFTNQQIKISVELLCFENGQLVTPRHEEVVHLVLHCSLWSPDSTKECQTIIQPFQITEKLVDPKTRDQEQGSSESSTTVEGPQKGSSASSNLNGTSGIPTNNGDSLASSCTLINQTRETSGSQSSNTVSSPTGNSDENRNTNRHAFDSTINRHRNNSSHLYSRGASNGDVRSGSLSRKMRGSDNHEPSPTSMSGSNEESSLTESHSKQGLVADVGYTIQYNQIILGSLVSPIHCLLNLHNERGYYFIFPDVSVRSSGQYSLHFNLFDVDHVMSKSNPVQGSLTSVVSGVFTVFSPKTFPGMTGNVLFIFSMSI